MRLKRAVSINRVNCPHCGEPTHIKKTKELSRLVREITCHCMNDECGHVFVAAITPIRTLVPSAMPDSTVGLPLSTRINVKQLQLQLSSPVKQA